MKSDALNMERFSKPTTDAPHELAAAVNLIRDQGLLDDTYDYPFWLRKAREANFDHPEEEVRRLIERMKSTASYLWEKKRETMNRGGWLTNRLKENAAGPQPRK